jgi:hypothetical protein
MKFQRMVKGEIESFDAEPGPRLRQVLAGVHWQPGATFAAVLTGNALEIVQGDMGAAMRDPKSTAALCTFVRGGIAEHKLFLASLRREPREGERPCEHKGCRFIAGHNGRHDPAAKDPEPSPLTSATGGATIGG